MFLIPFRNLVRRQGKDLTLTCTAQGGPNNSFAWEQNGQTLIGENESQLIVMMVNGSSGGWK